MTRQPSKPESMKPQHYVSAAFQGNLCPPWAQRKARRKRYNASRRRKAADNQVTGLLPQMTAQVAS